MTLTPKELKKVEHKQLPVKTCKKCRRVSKTQINTDDVCDTCDGSRPRRKDCKKRYKRFGEVSWQGEEPDDFGKIKIVEGKRRLKG